MKKLLCLVPALLLFATIGTPDAHADSYVATFNCTVAFHCEDAIPTAPDVSFPAPTDMYVTVRGAGDPVVFDMPLAADDAPLDTYTWAYTATDYNPTGYQYASFTLIDFTTNLSESITLDTNGALYSFPYTFGEADQGILIFTPASAAAPEPASFLLIVFGAGLIFLTRKRFVPPAARVA
jgi:hypothetical protein